MEQTLHRVPQRAQSEEVSFPSTNLTTETSNSASTTVSSLFPISSNYLPREGGGHIFFGCFQEAFNFGTASVTEGIMIFLTSKF